MQIAPARLLASGMPEAVDDVVVMLDGKQTFARIDPAGLEIFWRYWVPQPSSSSAA